MQKFQHVWWVMWIGLILITIIGTLSCGGDGSNDSPSVIPVSPFIADPGIDDEFAAFKGNEYFQVNVLPGEYLLTYTTNVKSYEAVFRATVSTLLTIWLQVGEQVNEATLFKGTISSGKAVAFTGAVVYVIQPGSGISWESVFVKADEAPIILIREGNPVIRTLPDPRLIRPTPTPEPTPEPTLMPGPEATSTPRAETTATSRPKSTPTPTTTPTPIQHRIEVCYAGPTHIEPFGTSVSIGCGELWVEHGASQTFTITCESGSVLDAMSVDRVMIDPVPKYTFRNITKDHEIWAYCHRQ